MRNVALLLLTGLLSVALFLPLPSLAATKLTIYPAPPGEPLSSAYKVQVEGRDVPAYQLRVAPEDKNLRIKGVDDKTQNGVNFDEAAFAYFDAEGSVDVTVTCNCAVTAARFLPASSTGPVKIQGNTIRFTVNAPQNLTLEVNHQVVRTLHIFVNPIETGAPNPQDANVLSFAPGTHQMADLKVPAGKTIFYFGPGIHNVDNLVVHDGQTVYIAGGAVVKSVIRPGAASVDSTLMGVTSKLYTEPAFKLMGTNIHFRGRGIVDGTPSLGKFLLTIQGQDISLEGVVLKNSGSWFMPISNSDRISVTNLKILGYRANSDGIDIYSSRDVTIQGCFVRTVDDVIVVKSKIKSGTVATEGDKVKNVVVRGNRLWNETGSAMKIGTEVGADISSVSFINNDVIRDLARGATEGIYLAGSGTVSNVRFEGNVIDRTDNQYDYSGESKGIFVYIRPSDWEASADKSRPLGKVRGVLFSNTQVETSPQNPKLRIQLDGASTQSDIQDVKFENISVNGKPLSKSNSAVEEKFATAIVGLP